MSSYSVLARHYDSLMQDFNYDQYCSFLFNTLKGNKGVDLACGSGRITIALAKGGKNVVGIDKSIEMLNVANNQAKSLGANIKFSLQDMLEFELHSKVDFITCICDGVNYLPQGKISEFFTRISNSLNDGGQFIFDISSQYKLEKIIASEVFFEDGEDLTYIWTNSLNKKSALVDMEIIFFEKDKTFSNITDLTTGQNGHSKPDKNFNAYESYKRFDERHRQFIHKKHELLQILNDLNFDVKVLDGEDFADEKSTCRRQVFICEKMK